MHSLSFCVQLPTSGLPAGRADPVRVQAEHGRAKRSDEEDAARDGKRAAVRDARRGQRQNASHVRLLHPGGIRYVPLSGR